MDGTGIYTWPGGSHLAGDLPDLIPWPPGYLRSADLGCGAGICGRTLLAAGSFNVMFCDGDPAALQGVRARIPTANTALHAWGDPLPDGPYDLILGGDILYRAAYHPALLASIAASLAPTGLALLSDPRTTLEEELPLIALKTGLSWMPERRPRGYTLIRIQRI